MHRQIKVAICGSPNCGKSVFAHVLASRLPRDRYTLIEGAPDGHGVNGWLYGMPPKLVAKLRKKGEFLPGYVDWIVRSIRQSTANITIVDLGGKITHENLRILESCTHYIVLGQARRQIVEWLEFGQAHNLELVAVLQSRLTGSDSVASVSLPIHGVVVGLRREEPPFHSPTVAQAASTLLELAGSPDRYLDGSEIADVNLPMLAESFNLPVVSGGVDRRWLPSIAPELVKTVATTCAGKPEIRIWGNSSSGFPHHVIACNFLHQRVRYYDPKINPGYVPLPEVIPSRSGDSLLHWRKRETSGFTHVHFERTNHTFDVFDLPLVIPPMVDNRKGVILTGRSMWWLTGTILRSYARLGVPWVATLNSTETAEWYRQQGSDAHGGSKGVAVVVATKSGSVPLGGSTVFTLFK